MLTGTRAFVGDDASDTMAAVLRAQADWDALRGCLADELRVDYSDLRGDPPRDLAAEEYVLAREEGLAGLRALLLDQPEQEAGFRALCRLGIEKPFECVGSVDESRSAMTHLAGMKAWKHMAIVQKLSVELSSLQVPSFESLVSARSEHCIPKRVLQDVAL